MLLVVWALGTLLWWWVVTLLVEVGAIRPNSPDTFVYKLASGVWFIALPMGLALAVIFGLNAMFTYTARKVAQRWF